MTQVIVITSKRADMQPKIHPLAHGESPKSSFMVDLADPGLMTDYELLLHVQQVHGPIPHLVHDTASMTAGVMRRVRDFHDEEHLRPNHKHWHNYIILEDAVAEQMDGVYFREEADGMDKRTNIYLARCNKPGCMFMGSSYEEVKIQERYDNHPCPQENGKSHYGASVTISLIEECWGKADLLYDKLQRLGEVDSENDSDNKPDNLRQQMDALRYELRGMAKILQVFVSPFFPSVKDVATEISKRYNLREAGQAYETPGTQTRVFDLPKPVVSEREQVLDRVKKVLDDKQIEAIKFAAKSGMFTHEQIASTYDVTVAVVREVCS